MWGVASGVPLWGKYLKIEEAKALTTNAANRGFRRLATLSYLLSP
jgi:hypothetical protein